MTHHAATGRHQYEEERPQHFGEETPPLLARVVEVLNALHDLLLVAGERSKRAERGNLLFRCHVMTLLPIKGELQPR